MAMIGLRPMSSPGTPEARIRARAPAMLRPWVTVRDLSSGIVARSFGADRLCGRSIGLLRAYAGHPVGGQMVRYAGCTSRWSGGGVPAGQRRQRLDPA
ncbi:hypothetical protein GCM10010365_38130 [Streptomyces poonensis]|uniref:Uncharacterized protein n=1 Tax=Streptomyces poonensis TaxID=68255 RepID=A0A918PKT3_9ACTN|nr:hypothetical protein GCM10010365_38130 [Streptomyces poonensis]GLJ93307.1 hypothetical protein GCM10017589_59190 [Streptomyces poonensis]